MDTILPSTSLFDDNGRSSFCIPNGHGFLHDQSPFGLGNAIVNVVTSTIPSAMPFRVTCMFCEKKWEMASSGQGKSPEMKRLEEIAVDHVFRQVIKAEDLNTLQEIVSRCTKNALNPVILCDACIMHFVHSEARVLKAQKEYLEKMTGPKEFSEVLADPWLDVKRFAFQKLKSNEAAIIEKLQLIENFNLENNVSSLMKSLNSSPAAHTSDASSVTFHLPLTAVTTSISSNEVTSLSVSRPSVTAVSAMHGQISQAEGVVNNLIMEVNNDNVQSATCQYTVSSVEVSSNSGSSATSPNHDEVPVSTIILHTDQTDTEIFQGNNDGKVSEVEVAPPPPENDIFEGEGDLIIDESQSQDNSNSNVGTSQDQESESNKVEAEKNVKGNKKKEYEDNTNNSDEIFEESDAERRDTVPPSATNKKRSSTANSLQANSKSPVIILKQLRSGSVAKSPAPSISSMSPPPKTTSSTSTSSKKRKASASEPKKKLFEESKTRKSSPNARNKRQKRESLKETNDDVASEKDDAGTSVKESKKTSKAQTNATKEKCTNGVVGVLLSELGQTTTPAAKTTAKNLSDSVTASGKKIFKIGNRYMTESSSSEDDDDVDDDDEEDAYNPPTNSKKSKNTPTSSSDSD